MTDGPPLNEMSKQGCLNLLAWHSVGRVACFNRPTADLSRDLHPRESHCRLSHRPGTSSTRPHTVPSHLKSTIPKCLTERVGMSWFRGRSRADRYDRRVVRNGVRLSTRALGGECKTALDGDLAAEVFGAPYRGAITKDDYSGVRKPRTK